MIKQSVESVKIEPVAAVKTGGEPPFGANEMRLSARQWLANLNLHRGILRVGWVY